MWGVFWGRGKGDTVLKARQDKPYHGRVPIEKKDAGFRRVAGASNTFPTKHKVRVDTHTVEKQSARTRLKAQGQFAHGTGGLAVW